MKAWPDDPLWVVPQFENRISALRASRRALSGAPQHEGVVDGIKKTPHPERERSEQSKDAGHPSNFKLRQYLSDRSSSSRACRAVVKCHAIVYRRTSTIRGRAAIRQS